MFDNANDEAAWKKLECAHLHTSQTMAYLGKLLAIMMAPVLERLLTGVDTSGLSDEEKKHLYRFNQKKGEESTCEGYIHPAWCQEPWELLLAQHKMIRSLRTFRKGEDLGPDYRAVMTWYLTILR